MDILSFLLLATGRFYFILALLLLYAWNVLYLGWNESLKFHDLSMVLFAPVHIKAVVSFAVANIKMFQPLRRVW